ncbi:uncharacterized protein NPIL_20101 [Nephila pilipes]|uniref:Uncharacterized protein n=1 Tax=Nephila pilipes TaxID=299642 RepID=A0A8X6PNH1_NEPPI|nr:uncharacterized protein NPIL_20101 [Nephila pilipes]
MEKPPVFGTKRNQFKANEFKVVSTLLAYLEKRLCLLRASLGEEKGTEELRRKFTSEKTSSVMDEGNQVTVYPSTDEYKLILDCCDVEAAISRVLHELTESGTFESLKMTIQEYQETSQSFEKHQKMLESKREEIAEQKQLLSAVQQKEESAEELPDDVFGKREELSSDNLAFVKQWMECRINSKKEFYEYLIAEVRNKTEYFETEARMQVHTDIQAISFWLLKYESCIKEVDFFLRKTFDEWGSKQREIAVLKKFRQFNLDKIERVSKEVALREEVIEADRKEKEIELQREKERAIKRAAAVLVSKH